MRKQASVLLGVAKFESYPEHKISMSEIIRSLGVDYAVSEGEIRRWVQHYIDDGIITLNNEGYLYHRDVEGNS